MHEILSERAQPSGRGRIERSRAGANVLPSSFLLSAYVILRKRIVSDLFSADDRRNG